MIGSRKEWFVEDFTAEMQRQMCKYARRYHKSEKQFSKFLKEGDAGYGVYVTRDDLRERGLAFCDANGVLTMVKDKNWAHDPMTTSIPNCPQPPDWRKYDPYERVIEFHVHPEGAPVPSRQDVIILFSNIDEQISCVGGGDNDRKKVYCYERPRRLKYFPELASLPLEEYVPQKDAKLREYRNNSVVENKRFEMAFEERNLYPFDFFADEVGEYVNELSSNDVINIFVSDDDDRHFEFLPDKLERISAVARTRVLEEEGIAKVHRFVCDDNDLFVPERINPALISQADELENEIKGVID